MAILNNFLDLEIMYLFFVQGMESSKAFLTYLLIIRKIEKISYKELVISNDSDNDEIIEEEPHSLPNSKNFNAILGPIRKVDRKKSLKTLYKIEDFINLNEETKEEKENNVQKTYH